MKYEELKRYNLIGGTGLAIHLNHRLSEDLDLFAYNQFPGKKFVLPDRDKILARFAEDFENRELHYQDKHDITIFLDGVKVQLRAENQFHAPKDYGNIGTIRIPSIETLLGMKLVALYLRNTWRDIFDLTFLARKLDLETFFSAFNKSMSSYFAGSKSGKVKLYNEVVEKLKNPQLLERLYQSDPMSGLITEFTITPTDVERSFKDLTYQ